MQIQFERTGGFANIRFAGNFDLDSLPTETANTLQTLLEQADFRSLPEHILGKSAIPDQFHYLVTVTTTAWEHSVFTDDRNAPEPLRQLIQKLNELTRAQSRQG
jgi:hypothetical protein